jgi:glycosyltransferase involved in cell wall biosynthesis
MPLAPLPDHVHVDARWTDGGIGRFAAEVLPLVRGGGRQLDGRLKQGGPRGQAEMALRFTPLGLRGGIFLSPGFSPPLGWERRSVVTVHDLHYLDPRLGSPRQHWYFSHVMLPQLRRCRLILTVSATSAEQIADALVSRGPEVVVVGNGVDPALLQVAPGRSGSRPQLLFVGGDKANKNLPMALDAFARVRRGTDVELTVVGHVAPALAAAVPAGVHVVGAVSEERLGELYAASTALLMPSIAEGFGLPALEAMVAGTPVIFGDRDALVDVVGRFGWPVDPFDVESVAAGIDAALAAPIEISFDEREELAAQHRWEDVARRLRDAVEEVL